MKQYLEFTYAEARKRYDAGMTFEQAAHDINWEAFRDWGDSERLLVNIETCYREFANDTLGAQYHQPVHPDGALAQGAPAGRARPRPSRHDHAGHKH